MFYPFRVNCLKEAFHMFVIQKKQIDVNENYIELSTIIASTLKQLFIAMYNQTRIFLSS